MNLHQASAEAEGMNLVGSQYAAMNIRPLQAEARSSRLIAPGKQVFLRDWVVAQRIGSHPAALQSRASGAGWTVEAASLLAHGIEAEVQPLDATAAAGRYRCNPQAATPRTQREMLLHHPKVHYCQKVP